MRKLGGAVLVLRRVVVAGRWRAAACGRAGPKCAGDDARPIGLDSLPSKPG